MDDVGSATPALRVVLAVTALLSFASSFIVHRLVFPLFSTNLDEGVYVFQAEMLRSGMVTLPADTHGEFFRPWLTGVVDGRIFTEYQPGLPAFLAITGALGSYRIGLALLASALTYATYGLVRELFGQPRLALGVAVATSFSPIFLVHSALVLTYTLTTVSVVVGSALWLMAIRRGSPCVALAAGGAIGLAAVTRPLDAVLFFVPFALLGLFRSRSGSASGTSTPKIVVAALAGVAGWVALLLVYNTATTGAPLRFPIMAADPLNKFGFGVRRLLPTEPAIDYFLTDAVGALHANVRGVPSWVLGGPVALFLAGFGMVVGRRRYCPEVISLVIATLAFPGAYLFWWATWLSAAGATNGIGPHYYVPAFVSLLVLAGLGVRLLRWTWRTALLALVVAAMATAWAVPDKVADKRSRSDEFERVEALVPADLSAAVVLMDTEGRPYILSRWPFLAPDPTLDSDVLYAADYSSRTPLLAERFDDRVFYRLRRELKPGDVDLYRPSGGFTRLSLVQGNMLRFRVEIDDGSSLLEGRSLGSVYVGPHGGDAFRRDGPVATFTVTGFSGVGDLTVLESTIVVVGVELVTSSGAIEYAEQRIPIAVSPQGALLTLTPGAGFYEFVLPDQRAWFNFDVSGLVKVGVTAG